MTDAKRAASYESDPLQNFRSGRFDSTSKIATSIAPGFVGYDEDGHFIHYCHCGKWGSFSHGISLRDGKLSTLYCREHRL
jgi:hypothetical protein